jgi:hypothetical protein
MVHQKLMNTYPKHLFSMDSWKYIREEFEEKNLFIDNFSIHDIDDILGWFSMRVIPQYFSLIA